MSFTLNKMTGLLFQSLLHQINYSHINSGNFPVVQHLGLGAFTAEGPSSTLGWGTKIPQASQNGQKKKKNHIILKAILYVGAFK